MSRIERLKDEGTRTQVIISGAIAGLVSRFCIAPLDVVKIRLQLQTHSLSDPLSCDRIKGPTYKGVWGTLRTIRQQEGVRALWKGNIPAELLYVCYGGAQFAAYRTISQLQQQFPVRLPSSAESFISGAAAGSVATTITYPLDLLRTRFAAQGTEQVYQGIRGALRDISEHEGLQGFFRGCSAANGQIIPYMGLFFSSYEAFHQFLGGRQLPLSSGDAIAGVLASVFSKTVVFPLDLVRKRLQVQGPTRTRYVHTNIPEYRGVIRSLIQINRREGIRGMYRGLTVSLLKNAPASAITIRPTVSTEVIRYLKDGATEAGHRTVDKIAQRLNLLVWAAYGWPPTVVRVGNVKGAASSTHLEGAVSYNSPCEAFFRFHPVRSLSLHLKANRTMLPYSDAMLAEVFRDTQVPGRADKVCRKCSLVLVVGTS